MSTEMKDNAVEESAPVAPSEQAAASEKEERSAGTASAPVPSGVAAAVLNGEVEIFPDRRLPHLDRGTVKAYAAQKSGQPQDPYFALICEKDMIPRTTMSGKCAGINSPYFVRLFASGVVKWPLDGGGERYVFVYENNIGRPLMTPGQASLGWKPDKVIEVFIKPMVSALMDLRDAGLPHGCINPFNIFDGGSKENTTRVVLGECLSSPPGFLQPALFEPVERAMTDPLGRGRGTELEDMYAFGVSLAMVLRSKDHLAGMSDEEILIEKIEKGSYATLTGSERYTGALLELLRGLLYDDPAQRWKSDDIMAWMDGQRLSPKQSLKKNKASRPIIFNDEKHLIPSVLAMHMSDAPEEAIRMVENKALEQWIKRSLEDKLTKTRYEEATEHSYDQGRGQELLLAKLSIALDPAAPVRFRGLRFHPDGFPFLMAHTIINKKDLQPYLDVLNGTVVMFWLNAQTDVRVDVGSVVSRYDSCRAFLRQATMGYGYERCLYFMVPECHCLSDILKDYYVRSPEDFLRALDDIAAHKKRPDSLFIDRHSAAFLSVKDRRMIDPYMGDLNASEYHRKIMGNIKVLATIQKRSKMEDFPALSGWVADILTPVYENYHDRELRDVLKKQVNKLKDKGNLAKMIVILDNNDTWQDDFINFRKAMKEYSDLREEHAKLARKMEKPETFGQDTGREVAAVVSGILACVLILAIAFFHFTGTAVF